MKRSRPFAPTARNDEGQALIEYGIIITLLSATLWAVFATWEIWGWGGGDIDERAGMGQTELAANLDVDDLDDDDDDLDDDDDAPEPVPPPPPPPTLVNSGGTFTVTNAGVATRANVRYMGANAGLASVSSLWMRVRSAAGVINDVRLTENNTGGQRDVIAERQLQTGDEVSFFLRVQPRAWSQNYYNWMKSRGRLTGTGNSAYYDVFSSASTGPNNVTTVNHFGAGAAGNVFGTDEFHIGFEDLALDWSGCDRDYNDAEIRVSLFDAGV